MPEFCLTENEIRAVCGCRPPARINIVNPYAKFTIASIAGKLNRINTKITLSHQSPFPKLDSMLLSHYTFHKRFVTLYPNGGIQGGFPRLITSLIDFSFLRSLAAPCYSIASPPCYDPVSLFLLDLFRYIDGCQDMNDFLKIVKDKDRGRGYRTYAGITDNIPSEGTFSNFRIRLGESLYNEIFHILVGIFQKLSMITFRILSHDGTLYPSWARYKGCTYFCNQCSAIPVPDVRNKIKAAILYRLNTLSQHNLNSEVRVKVDCPSERFPKDLALKKPRIEVFAFKLAFIDGEFTTEQKNNAAYFDVHEELQKQNLCIHTVRSTVSDFNEDGSLIISCPKLPKDTDARIGVRKDPKNPDKTQKIFGYNAILSTSVEIQMGIELPVAISHIPGNADEGSYLINNRKQIQQYHAANVMIDIADAKYDITDNYCYIREQSAIPIIDYNPRNEKLSKANLKERGYDLNGWPFAPCGILTRPNGFEDKYQRLTFCCFKACLNLKAKDIIGLNDRFPLKLCPHIQNKTGFTKHMYVKEHPRLINQIPRGSKTYLSLKKLRSASERINSTLKEPIPILAKPRVLNQYRSAIIAHMAAITLLIKRAFSFIVRITTLFRKYHNASDPKQKAKLAENLQTPIIPKSIKKLIQLE